MCVLLHIRSEFNSTYLLKPIFVFFVVLFNATATESTGQAEYGNLNLLVIWRVRNCPVIAFMVCRLNWMLDSMRSVMVKAFKEPLKVTAIFWSPPFEIVPPPLIRVHCSVFLWAASDKVTEQSWLISATLMGIYWYLVWFFIWVWWSYVCNVLYYKDSTHIFSHFDMLKWKNKICMTLCK